MFIFPPFVCVYVSVIFAYRFFSFGCDGGGWEGPRSKICVFLCMYVCASHVVWWWSVWSWRLNFFPARWNIANWSHKLFVTYIHLHFLPYSNIPLDFAHVIVSFFQRKKRFTSHLPFCPIACMHASFCNIVMLYWWLCQEHAQIQNDKSHTRPSSSTLQKRVHWKKKKYR